MREIYHNRPAEESSRTAGRNIRILRRNRSWTVNELSQRSGVARIAINQLEAGIGNPLYPTVEKIARALGVSLNRLAWAGETTSGRVIREAMDRADRRKA